MCLHATIQLCFGLYNKLLVRNKFKKKLYNCYNTEIAAEAENDVVVEFEDVDMARLLEVSEDMRNIIADSLNEYCSANTEECCSIVDIRLLQYNNIDFISENHLVYIYIYS